MALSLKSALKIPYVLRLDDTSITSGGIAPPPLPLGPLDYADYNLGAFDDFSHSFDLASSSAVFGLVARYTGDPVISMAHGGEPLTIVHEERNARILSLIAVGRGLTIEPGLLTINVTGGSVGGGAIRINEMVNIKPALSGWVSGQNGPSGPIPVQTMTGTDGGIVKIAFGATLNDPSRRMRVIGADTVWDGYLSTGTPSNTDFGPSGDWTLESGWSWDGDDLVHTGRTSSATIPYIYEAPGRGVSIHAFAELESGGVITISPSSVVSGNSVSGPLNHNVYGPMSAAVSTGPTESLCTIKVSGNARLSNIGAMSDGTLVSWVFASVPAEEGETIQGFTTYNPSWTITAAEILEDAE